MNKLNKHVISNILLQDIKDHFEDYNVTVSPHHKDTAIVMPKVSDLDDIFEYVTTGEDVFLLDNCNQLKFDKIMQRKLHTTFRDYRVVDVLHVNKLMSQVKVSTTHAKAVDILGNEADIVHGTITLPGAFVIANEYSKAAQGGKVDLTQASLNLADTLETAADAKLWEFEGYRLYRTLNNLDAMREKFFSDTVTIGDISVDPAMLIANCASVLDEETSDYVYLAIDAETHHALISTSQGKLTPVIAAIPRAYYTALCSIINTYIEFS